MKTVTNSSSAVVAAKLTKSAVPAGRTVVAAKPAAPVKAVPAKTAVKTAKPAVVEPTKAKPTVKPTAPTKAKPAAPTKTKPVKKNATKGSAGRPKKVLKLIMNRTFSLRDVVSVNPTTNKLTVRKHILDGVKSGVFMKLTETIATGKRGKPAHLFISANQQTVADGLNAAVAGAAVA